MPALEFERCNYKLRLYLLERNTSEFVKDYQLIRLPLYTCKKPSPLFQNNDTNFNTQLHNLICLLPLITTLAAASPASFFAEIGQRGFGCPGNEQQCNDHLSTIPFQTRVTTRGVWQPVVPYTRRSAYWGLLWRDLVGVSFATSLNWRKEGTPTEVGRAFVWKTLLLPLLLPHKLQAQLRLHPKWKTVRMVEATWWLGFLKALSDFACVYSRECGWLAAALAMVWLIWFMLSGHWKLSLACMLSIGVYVFSCSRCPWSEFLNYQSINYLPLWWKKLDLISGCTEEALPEYMSAPAEAPLCDSAIHRKSLKDGFV